MSFKKKKSLSQITKGGSTRLLHHFARHMMPSKLRVILHKMRGVNIGKNVFIGLDVYIDDGAPNLVTIEDNVLIAAGCMILAHERNLENYGVGKWVGDCPHKFLPTKISVGAHIGARTVILPGVTIGKGAIIGAQSLVNKSIGDYCLAVGVPAKVIKNY